MADGKPDSKHDKEGAGHAHAHSDAAKAHHKAGAKVSGQRAGGGESACDGGAPCAGALGDGAAGDEAADAVRGAVLRFPRVRSVRAATAAGHGRRLRLPWLSRGRRRCTELGR